VFETVALLVAAVRGHREDELVDRAAFLSSAARGRPAVSDLPARAVALRFEGRLFRFLVQRLGAARYHVEASGRGTVLTVGPTGNGPTLLEFGGASWTVSWPDGPAGSAVEVNGIRFSVDRERGIVPAPVPAVVVAVLVADGQHVRRGDPLVVLEAMKMEMVVRAPEDGWIRGALVRPNMQVKAGSPLVQLGPDERSGEEGRVWAGFESFEEAHADRASDQGAPPHLEAVLRMVLGFDVDPRTAVPGVEGQASGGDEASSEVLRIEDRILAAFADVTTLARRVVPDEDGNGSMRAEEMEFLAYLRFLDPDLPMLSESFKLDLSRALAHHGVRSFDRGEALEEALFHVFRAHCRVAITAPAILDILDGRLADLADLPAPPGPDFQAVLERIAASTRGRHPGVSDMARELLYRCYAQPVMDRARRDGFARAQADIAALEGDPDGPGRAACVASLVECPQPLKRILTERIQTARGDAKAALLEALARRYYRIRDLSDVRARVVKGRAIVQATYPHDGTTVDLVVTHGTVADAPAAVAAAARVVRDAGAADHDVVVDLYLWAPEPGDQVRVSAESFQRLLDDAPFGRTVRRVVVAVSSPSAELRTTVMEHFTFRPSPDGYREELLYRGLHPMMGKRLDLWRLSNFRTERLPSVEDVFLFRAVARDNPRDERLFALAEVRDLTPVHGPDGTILGLPGLELALTEALEAIRLHQSYRPSGGRLQWNRVVLGLRPAVELDPPDIYPVVRRLAPLTDGLGLEKVVVRGRFRDHESGRLEDRVLHISSSVGRGLALRFDVPAHQPIRTLSPYMQKVVQGRQRGLVYPYEIVRMLTPSGEVPADVPPGRFQELDLDASGRLGPVDRPFGENSANVVVGLLTNYTSGYPDGIHRVVVLGDPSRSLGSLAEPECSRIVAALDLAEREGYPLEWFAVSAGAKISMSSGTENMDWIGRVLRRLIEFTQAGGEVNVVVCGINVGAQPYWNAEATMLMHTRGILVMTPDGALVLTGKQALDYSGGVSAEDNVGIGGYDRVMGPNGQAQYWAPDLHEAIRILLRHYEHTYVVPGERFPRRIATSDPRDRDATLSPHRPLAEAGFSTVGDIFSDLTNPGRKKPFDMRSLMQAVIDQDHPPLERWQGMMDAEIAVVWDAHLGGWPVCLLGIESHPLPRHEIAPADGPEFWTSGTLFPLASKKVARAINAASGNRPVVILANLSGFDGSPESLRRLQLEYGAEIGRAVVNFRGPLVFCVVSRYHGGAFVVFSKTLNEGMEVAAVEGSYASVIGGPPAAAVVFAREVDERTGADPRVEAAREAVAAAASGERARLQTGLEETIAAVRSERLGEVAAEYDQVHSIFRAREKGSVDRIIAPRDLRPYLIDAVERGLARCDVPASAEDLEVARAEEPVPLGR
jgi:acetyl-CoA carboxylase carboxyltransferase component/pyruvate/2-oxoglutarate dehydrogenase complex dihydrolipoamide acyltransferase (E2) component